MSSARLRPAALTLATIMSAGALVLIAAPAHAAPHAVTTYDELETAVLAAVDGDVITFEADITAEDDLPELDDNITVDGAGFTYDAGGYIGMIVNGATVTISNLTLTDPDSSAPGFAVYAAGSLTLQSVATNGGVGAIDDSNVTITDSAFTTIGSQIEGAGIDVVIERTSFDDVISSPAGGDGVEINITDGTVTLTDVSASGNDADGVDVDVDGDSTFTATRLELSSNGSSGLESETTGGAVTTISASTTSDNDDHGFDLEAWDGGSVTITDTSASDNSSDGFDFEGNGEITATRITATGNGDDGIQIVGEDGANFTITDSTSDGNGYGLYLDEFYVNGGSIEFPVLNVISTTLSNNDSDGVLGGISDGATVRFVNSTISGNDYGLDVDGDGSLSIHHTTVTDNGDVGYSPNTFGDSLTIDISHSVFAGNNGDVDLDSDDDIVLTVAHSLIGTADPDAEPAIIAGTGNLFDAVTPIDALLGALADNGGPTLTHLPAETSPAVDAGDPAIAGAPITDQRGLTRIMDVIDMGSVEWGAVPLPTDPDPVDPDPVTPAVPAEMPPTGADIAPLALGALLLLLAGAVLALRRRSRAL